MGQLQVLHMNFQTFRIKNVFMQKVQKNLLVYGKNTQNGREVHIGPVEPRDKKLYSQGSDFVHGFMERER